jgi:P-type Ca2+ transporter type 2C
VPADLRLLETTRMEINESALTGESLGVKKTTEAIPEDNPPLGDRKNIAFMGTVVLSGRGRGLVFATGTGTEIGKISEKVKDLKQLPTPLQIQFVKLGRLIGVLIVFLSLVAFAGGLLAGYPLSEIFSQPLRWQWRPYRRDSPLFSH